MLTEAQAAELRTLRARVYGPGEQTDAATLGRLAELERERLAGDDAPRDSAAADTRADASGATSHADGAADDPAPSDHGAPPPGSWPWSRRRLIAVLVAVAAAIVIFVAGVLTGILTTGDGRTTADVNTGIPENAAQVLDRIRGLQPWDEDTVQFVGSIRQVTVWVGSVRNGRSACAVFDRPGGAAGDSTQIDCHPTLSDADYPVRLQWVREFSGISETYSVLLRRSGETQLSYGTS